MVTKATLVLIAKKHIGPMAENWLDFQCKKLNIDCTQSAIPDDKALELAVQIGSAAVLLVGRENADKIKQEMEAHIN